MLPQYHPRQLMELMNAGKTRRVKAILLHVLYSLRSHNNVTTSSNTLRAHNAAAASTSADTSESFTVADSLQRLAV